MKRLILLLIPILFIIGCSDDDNDNGVTPEVDTTAPAAISDLSTHNPTATTVMLIFTSPGDDDFLGRPNEYDIRYSTSLITEGNFAAAARFDTLQQPEAGTVLDTIIVTGLQPQTTYYFAVKTGDEVPNWSTISNIDSATTLLSDTWTVYTTANSNLPNDTVTSIALYNAVRYFSTNGGATELLNNNFTTYDSTLSLIVDTIVDSASDTTFDTTTVLPTNYINSIDLASDQTIWVGLDNFGIAHIISTDSIELYNSENSGLAFDAVRDIAVDNSDNIWMTTAGDGLYKFDGVSSWTHLTTADGLSNNFMSKVYVDESNNIWVSYNVGGVTKYDGSNFTHYNSGNGLETQGVTDIMSLGSGNMLFGSEDGVFLYENSNWINYTVDSGLIDNVVTAVARDSSGAYWFGTRFGLMKKNGPNWVTYTTANSYLPGNYINDINVDFLGNLIIATNNGAAVLNEN